MNSQPPGPRPMNGRSTMFGGFCALGAVAGRLLINAIKIPNFNPIGGLGVVGGSKQPLWLACLGTLVAMVVSDLLLFWIKGFPSDHFLMVQFVYPSMLVYVLCGRLLIKQGAPLRLGLASVLGSAQFYLITNFGSWMLYTDRYSPDWTGLAHSYVEGLPFLGWTLLGDLIFTAVYAGAYALAEKPATESAHV